MTLIKTFSIILITSFISFYAGSQEYYFKFKEHDRNKINTVITTTISIDKVENGEIFAYANPSELKKLILLGYKPELLAHPSSLAKVLNMATTIDQMASWDRYPTYEVYRAMLKKFESDYPEICKLDSIGNTLMGRKLYVLKISDNVSQDEAEPEFFYTSTMHGDETTGYVLMLRLADFLLSNYGTDERVINLVDNIAIFINPNANPDGTYNSGNHTVSGSTRYNNNGYDLNRNFPDPRVGENPDGPYQIETIAMMNFAQSRHFILSANFHGGTEVVNFPWDAWTSDEKKHPDHNWYYHISRQYADLVHDYSPSSYFSEFDNGVTHGGDWYVVFGGRQDYMNYWHHCKEVTLEISDTKLLSTDLLPAHWNYNKESILSYMELVFNGFNGVVTNSEGEPLDATITIQGHDLDNSHVVTNPNHGNYYRMIEPGTWQVTYSAEGYKDQTHTIIVDDYNSSVTKDVVLESSTDVNGPFLGFENASVWPNPFHDQLTIKVNLLLPTTLKIEIFSIAGQRVDVIANDFYPLGERSFHWSPANGISNGVYILKISSGFGVETGRVVFSRN